MVSLLSPRNSPIPVPSLILGYLPIIPLVLAGILVWFAGPALFALTVDAAVLWASILLFFLAGVRRGLSFFTDGGPQPAQILTMFWLFFLGLVVLVSPYSPIAVGAAAVGFASLGVCDARAAGHGQVPGFFRDLRPPQTGLATAAMISVLLSLWL